MRRNSSSPAAAAPPMPRSPSRGWADARAFAGPLGDAGDAVSNRIVADLAAEGIDCSGAVRVAGGTASVSLILLDARGEKTIATRRGAKLGNALPADAGEAGGGRRCRAGRQPFSGIRHGGVPRRAGAQASRSSSTSIRRPSRTIRCSRSAPMWSSSAEALRGTTGLERSWRRLCKRSAEAALRLPRRHRRAEWRLLAATTARCGTCRPFKVKAIDTLGAGDAFHGAFTLALAEGRALTRRLRFASATAALKCTHFGGGAGAPQRAEVEEFLKQNPG